MSKSNDRWWSSLLVAIIMLALWVMACSLGTLPFSPSGPPVRETPLALAQPIATGLLPATPTSVQLPTLTAPLPVVEAGRPRFGALAFCEKVTADGQPVDPRDTFSGGSTRVRALFTFENMVPGQPWGRLWERDGEAYVEARNQVWEDEAKGWVSYSISDEDGLPSGHYTVTLFIGDEAVQRASFTVAPSPARVQTASAAAFGAITFARGVTAKNDPLQPSVRFEAGITEVHAVFVYLNMSQSRSWVREWAQDGKVVDRQEQVWDGGNEGVGHSSLLMRNGLSPGQYKLNLYIDGQLARSADFAVSVPSPQPSPTPAGLARPEDMIDPDLLPAWQKLAGSGSEVIRGLAQFVLKTRIPMRVEADYVGMAAYRYSCAEPLTPGKVVVSRKYWSETSRDELTAALAHELTHAVWHMSGAPCFCTIDKEYHAHVAEIYVLQDLGRKDILKAKWGFAYDANGHFSESKLWQALKKLYSECVER